MSLFCVLLSIGIFCFLRLKKHYSKSLDKVACILAGTGFIGVIVLCCVYMLIYL